MRRFDNVTVRNVGGTCRQGQSRLSPLHPFWIHGFKRHDPLARDGFELFPQRRLVVCDELNTLPPRLISTYRVFCGRIVWNRQRFIKDPDTGKRVSRPSPEEEWSGLHHGAAEIGALKFGIPEISASMRQPAATASGLLGLSAKQWNGLLRNVLLVALR